MVLCLCKCTPVLSPGLIRVSIYISNKRFERKYVWNQNEQNQAETDENIKDRTTCKLLDPLISFFGTYHLENYQF